MKIQGTALELIISAVHLDMSVSSQFFVLQFETAKRNAEGAQYFTGRHHWELSIELLRAQRAPHFDLHRRHVWTNKFYLKFANYCQIIFMRPHKNIRDSLYSLAVQSNMVEKEAFLWNILYCKSHTFFFHSTITNPLKAL